MHSQNPKPPRRVLVEVEEHIQTSDSRKLFSVQFVILLWTSENFCLLAQLLPISWSFSSKDINKSGTQIVIPSECHGHIMERLIPAPSLTVSSCLHYSRDVVEVLHCSFTTFCLPSAPSSFAAPLPLVTGGGQPEVQVFLYIDLSIFNGLVLPRAGAILFRFRWASDAVRACCHSVQLKSESVRPWKCINGHPRGKSHVHQFWASDEKKKKRSQS